MKAMTEIITGVNMDKVTDLDMKIAERLFNEDVQRGKRGQKRRIEILSGDEQLEIFIDRDENG